MIVAQCGSEPLADDAKGLHAHLEQLEQLHLKRRAVSRSLRQHFLLLSRALFCPPLFAVAFCKPHPSVGALEWQPAEESWLNGKEEREDTRGHLTRRRIILPWSRRSWQPYYDFQWSREGARYRKKRSGGESVRKGDGWRIKNPECADIGDLSLCLLLAWCVLPLYRFVHTHTHQYTSTHTLFALEDDPRRPRQETRTPSKELLTPSHPSPSAHLPPSFPKVPSLWPVQPTWTSHNVLELESHTSHLLRALNPPPGSALSDFSHIGRGRPRSFIFPRQPAGCPSPPGLPALLQ